MNTKSQFDIQINNDKVDFKRRSVDETKPKQDKNLFGNIGFLSSIGFVIITPLVVMTGAGIYFDQRFSTAPYGKYIGLLIGFAFSISGFVKQVTDFIKNSNKQTK